MNLIEETEKNFTKFIGTKHAIMVNSGTAALHTAYLACNLESGDEVIISPYTYTSAANMILACNATPVFADIRDDYLMDLDQMAKKITEKTKAVVFTNLFGKEYKVEDYEATFDILNDMGIKIIIDSAQCVKSGVTYGDIQCFSFYKTKNFSCFEGGAFWVFSDEPTSAARYPIIQLKKLDNPSEPISIGYSYTEHEQLFVNIWFYSKNGFKISVSNVEYKNASSIQQDGYITNA